MKKLLIHLLLFSTSLVLILACNSDSGNPSDDFDRKAMLENFAQNLIQPAFEDLQTQVNALKTASGNFAQNANSDNLTALQVAWQNAYTSFQFASAYNFGPAGEQGIKKGLSEEIAIFPVSTTKIESAITNNNANFNDFNRDVRGFLAIEYLIFDLDDDNARIITDFSNQNRKDFLTNATNNIKTRVDEVLTAWNSTYSNEFINNDGTDVGSSTSQLYNEFVRSYESIKNFKVGLPLGKRPGQTQTEPQLVEAYYSGKSLQMLENHLIAIENIWLGKSKNGNDGIGFKEYLENVEGGSALISSTEDQLAVIKQAINILPDSPRFSAQISTNSDALDYLHTELQRHTRYFKSDMSSLLGIAITFSSGDGD
jgi:hypothetical protein